MKKVFFALMFLSLAGAGVLFWLIRSSPSDLNPTVKTEHAETHDGAAGLHIVDDKHEEVAKVDEHGEAAKEGEATEGSEHGEAGKEGEEKHEAASDVEKTEVTDSHAENHEEKAGEAAKAPPALAIRTEPPAAKVWVDGKLRGETPMDIPLLPKTQMVQLEAEGFEDFTRIAPSDAEAGNGQLNWKIQLKEKVAAAPEKKVDKKAAEKKTAHKALAEVKAETKKFEAKERSATLPVKTESAKSEETHAESPESSKSSFPKDVFRKGHMKPYLIQLKSVERVAGWDDSVKKLVMKYRDDLAAVAHTDVVFGCPVKVKEGQWVRILVGSFPSKAVAQERLREFKKFVPDAYITGAQGCQP